MPHFLKPPANPPAGYDADNKLAPGSLWRVLIPLVGTRTVALRGGAGLKVTSNNPNVVPADGLKELAPLGDLRIFEIFGASEGGSWIDVWGVDGAFLIRLQALVQKAAGQPGGAAGGKRIVDIIVRFQGSKFTAEMAERDVFPDAALARYKTSAVAANREVARAGYFTKEIGQGARCRGRNHGYDENQAERQAVRENSHLWFKLWGESRHRSCRAPHDE
jgi:hypothetical protein